MSSFIKKKQSSNKSKLPHLPPGCKPSIYNNQTVISSGVAAIDFLLGGGIPLGSLVLIEEDELRIYSNLLLRYFTSEGILCGHRVIVSVSIGDDFINQLPGQVDNIEVQQKDESVGDSMKIAFRYEALQQVDSEFSSAIKFCHSFDLTHKLDYNTFVRENPNLTMINNRSSSTAKLQYSQLLQSIRDNLNTANGVIRIVLQHMGSVLWDNSGPDGSREFIKFLFNIRALTRCYPVTFLLSYPTYNHSEIYLNRIRYLSDAVYRLECFQSSDKEVSPLFSDYHGLFHLVKLPKINSLQSFIPETLNFGFKAKKRKFVIEKLHLPPELGEDDKKSTTKIKVRMDKKLLEF
ncbi:Elongator complex protein 4-like [Oopsacas minuta]|uniref:Elongator complex protein 4 n=1 Tax=Oopsacas minuta TaxID=111878 RepID=A0AAV7JLT7_9METZ|nr:Elongator complex protein 4-like [Oopsacas minuta]